MFFYAILFLFVCRSYNQQGVLFLVDACFTSTGSVQTTFGCCSCGPEKKPPSVVTSDQPLFDPGTSTSGPSSGVTVGGTGSSLVQTTGEAAQRVHLPDVAVTLETLISPVHIFGMVPVLFRLLVGSLASQ